MSAIVTVKCITCGTKRNIAPGEVGPTDHPMCNTCGMPMLPVKAVLK